MSTMSGRYPQVPLQWQEHRSAHFVFWFMPGSQAEKNITALASSLESLRDATVKVLDLKNLPDEQIQIYLSDVPLSNLPGGQSLEGRQDDSLVYEAEGRQILAVYQSEASGGALEHALMELLLSSSWTIRAARSAMLVDGMLGYVAQQTGEFDLIELNAMLANLQGKGQRIALVDVLGGTADEAKPLYRQLVTSFVIFLLTTYGVDRFKRFAENFDPDLLDRATQTAYGKSMAILEEEWLVNLQQGQASSLDQMESSAPGVIVFSRGALSYLRPYWGQEALILLAAVVGAAFTVFLPLAFGWVIDALREGDYSYLWPIVLVVVILFIVQVPAMLGQDYLGALVGSKVTNDIQYKMFDHLQRLSTDFYFRTRPGAITSRFTNDLDLLNLALTQAFPMLARLGVTFVGSLISLFFLQGLLALLVVLVLPIFLILPVRFGTVAAKATHEMQQNRAMVASTLQENVGAQQVIKAYSLQETALGRFRAQLDELGRSVARGGFLSALPGTTTNLSLLLIQVLALAGGAVTVYYGALGVGALVSFQLLLGGVTGPMMSITGIWQMLLQSAVGMQRINELLNERPKITDAPNAKTLERFSRDIRFEDVSFSYTGEQLNLRDVNLTISAGQSVAFVGPSGSGKSTILNLIMRFYDPVAGTVSIDGQDLRHITQESLRSQIGTVFQETFLYSTTVRENITLGKPDATDGEVEEAARAAEIHDFILTLPKGYNTQVGERGGQLSGGQRQRIALARAILYNPAILLLDEPTSALDPQTEAAINHTLHVQGQERTVVTVTHRLSSVVDADRIFVLERGRVVEQGTHKELFNAQGLYYRLWGQQNGFEDAERVGVEASRLRAIPLFENMDEALLSTLAGRFVAERHAEGQTIFEEGDPGDKLYFVDRGEVEVMVTGPTGEKRRVALLRDGDYFGEIALLEGVPRTASVRTRAPSILLGLDREQFLDLLRDVPALRVAFERGVEARRRANLATLQEVVQAGDRR